MKMKRTMGPFRSLLWENLPGLLLFLAIGAIFLYGLSDAAASSAEEGLRIAEDSVRRAVVSCYAIEGNYPDTYEYLVEHYGVRIDSKYIVRYEIFASNIMPDITVYEG